MTIQVQLGLSSAVMVMSLMGADSFPLEGWNRRLPVTVDNTANASTLTNFQVKVPVTYDSQMDADFYDIRFTDSDGETVIDHWTESRIASTSAVFWVEIPSIPASSSKTIYMYFGNPSALDASDGDSTFLFFDDFGDGRNWEAAGAPAGAGVVETSMIMDGSAVDMWYRGGWNPSDVGYARSEDPAALKWMRSDQNPIFDDTIHVLPYVLKEGLTYYMFVKHSDVGNIFLYSSTNKVDWTIMNSGNPVYTRSANASDWDRNIYNCAVVVVDGVWHMMLEGQSSTSDFRLGYAFSDLNELNWSAHRTTSPLIDSAGNPFLIHVPERSAILMLYGNFSTGTWRISARRASTSNDLSLAASWVLASNFLISQGGIHIADPDLVVTNGLKDHNIILQYGYNQASIYQKYSDLSLPDLYDAIGGASNYVWIDEPTNPVFEAPSLNKWTVRGSMVLDGLGELTMPSNANSDQTPTFENATIGSSYVMETKARTTSTGDRLQPVFAYVNDSNFARFWFQDPDTSWFQQKLSGSFGGVTNVGANNAVDGSNHKIKIIKTGTQATLFIDDAQIGSPQNLSATFNTNTRVGVSGFNTAGKWDYVLVRKYANPEPSVSVG